MNVRPEPGREGARFRSIDGTRIDAAGRIDRTIRRSAEDGRMLHLVDTYFENRWIVQPTHANSLGTVHGGNVMKWMDELGGLSAMRFAARECVTVAVEQVTFERPIDVGDVAVVEAYVYEAGETSVRTRLRAFREDPETGEREPTTDSHATYVAIDGDHRPVPVPELTVDSERGRRLRREALDHHDDGD